MVMMMIPIAFMVSPLCNLSLIAPQHICIYVCKLNGRHECTYSWSWIQYSVALQIFQRVNDSNTLASSGVFRISLGWVDEASINPYVSSGCEMENGWCVVPTRKFFPGVHSKAVVLPTNHETSCLSIKSPVNRQYGPTYSREGYDSQLR